MSDHVFTSNEPPSQLLPPYCSPEIGCGTVRALNEHTAALDEQLQRHDASLRRLFDRVDGIYKQNIAILVAVMTAIFGFAAGLIFLVLRR